MNIVQRSFRIKFLEATGPNWPARIKVGCLCYTEGTERSKTLFKTTEQVRSTFKQRPRKSIKASQENRFHQRPFAALSELG